jgi:prepilin-type N-terminal cleavage/methylation domain-containing protein
MAQGIKGMKQTMIRRQDGVSMAEVMVAMLILAIGSLAVLNLITASANSSYRNQQTQVVSDRLQQEMERITALPYAKIALTGLPAGSADTSSPASRVQGVNYAVNRNGTGAAPLVYNGSALYNGGSICDANNDCGVVDPTPTPFTTGDVSGTIYRYVVWQNDTTCPDASCPGSQDFKRVIVAVALNTTAPGGVRPYQEIQTQVTDPNSVPPQNTCTGSSCATGGTVGTPWTFWLTDTPCDYTDRQPLTGDHLVHSTDGVCGNAAGSPPTFNKKDASNCTTNILNVTSCPPGAPDLMVTNPPTLSTETPLYDYSTDIQSNSPSTDKGLLMPKPSSNGCLSSLFQPLTNVSGALIGDPDTSRMQQIHKWVTPLIGTGFNVTLSGTGELDLWTQSINAASYPGKICFWIFERHLNNLNVPVDTPVTTNSLTYFTYSAATWPTGWTELHIPLSFGANVTLGPTSRLGFALQVERAGTSGGGLNFLYDEPSFDSRLQVNTSTPLLPF